MSYFAHETNISNLCKYESVQSLDSLNRGKFGNLASRCEARPELQADSPDLTQYKSVFLFLNKNNKFIYIIIYGQRNFFLFSTGLHRPGRSTTFHRALDPRSTTPQCFKSRPTKLTIKWESTLVNKFGNKNTENVDNQDSHCQH